MLFRSHPIARLQLLDGTDPIEAKKQAKAEQALAAAKTITFEQATTQYFNANEKRWKNPKHRNQFLSSMKAYAFPKFGKLPVNEIDRGLVLQVLDAIWQDKTETASRVRGRIERVLDWASVRGFRSGENPARWRGHLEHALPARGNLAKPQHHPALPYRELPDFIRLLRTRMGVAACAVEFTILTAARTGEVIGATWDEINLEEAVWTVPASRMKAKKEHRVPLSDRSLEILRALPRERNNPFVFIGPHRSGLSNMAMASVLRRMDRKDITVHGFRSTFRDWAAERTAYDNPVVEQALAHTIGNAVERAYRRGDMLDKRRKLMSDWASYSNLTGWAGNEGQVIPIRG